MYSCKAIMPRHEGFHTLLLASNFKQKKRQKVHFVQCIKGAYSLWWSHKNAGCTTYMDKTHNPIKTQFQIKCNYDQIEWNYVQTNKMGEYYSLVNGV